MQSISSGRFRRAVRRTTLAVVSAALVTGGLVATAAPSAAAGCSQTNETDVAIRDKATVESTIIISGCLGNASAAASVAVNIVHTHIGDLFITLIAPDGSPYLVRTLSGGSADNINQTYTVNLSSEAGNGTWKLRVQDTAYGNTGYINSWSLGGPEPVCSSTNQTDVTIPDNATVTSSIAIAGCTGNASATSQVGVNIVHTYIGDLIVTLVAPDGSTYVLHNRTGGSADNINQAYTVNLSSEVKNGTWTLRVQDAAADGTGYINSWTANLSGPGPACSGTNQTDVTIPDNATVTSNIAIAGCAGNASATSQVPVSIAHPYISDLIVTLVAPDGSTYVLHNRTGGNADNINETFTVDLSNEYKNGTWTLRVQDATTFNSGYLNSWSLNL